VPTRCLPASYRRRPGHTQSADPWDRPGRTGADSREPAGYRPPGRDRAQVLEGHWATGVRGQGLRGVLFGPRQVSFLQVGDPQGYAGVGVLRRDLQAAEQQLDAPIELAEVHVAEAQVVEEIGIVGILAKEFLQVDAGLVELAGGEELVGMEVAWGVPLRWQ